MNIEISRCRSVILYQIIFKLATDIENHLTLFMVNAIKK